MENSTEQIVRKYGGHVEQRVAACGDKKVAKYLKQNICLEVERHIKDESLLKNIETYIDNLIDTRFSRDRTKCNEAN